MATMLVYVLSVATLATLALSAAPPGYEKLGNGGYYKLHRTYSTWFNAAKTCKDEGANLLVLNSQREADAIKVYGAILQSMRDGAWIGVHDLYVENVFVDIFGNRLERTSYNKWTRGEPNNAKGNEHCVEISPAGTYNDATCSANRPFICEARK